MKTENFKIQTMNKPFKIPLQSEVIVFIKEKKNNWPQKFVEYYADRFWNFYQSNGWKVSGRAAMKNWHAAFNSQWQHLQYKQDIDFLNKCLAQEPNIPQTTRQAAFLNSCLADHLKHWDKIPEIQYAEIYDYMKNSKMIKMTDEEKEDAKRLCNGNVIKGKAMCVKFIFNRMITNNEHFA
jgi:hypothetical protein